METPRRSDPWRPSVGYLLIALGIAVGGLGAVLMFPTSQDSVAADPAAPPASPGLASGATPTRPLQSMPTPLNATPGPQARPAATETPEVNGSDPTPDLSSYVNRGEQPKMTEVIERLHQAGVHTGLGAFSPPGTRPPLIGLAVPEDFVLPPGYVRHHQATDDGQRIEAILMFAPDHPFFDRANRPIEIPKNRVVPPELAPPGLPLRPIVIPAPTDPARSGL